VSIIETFRNLESNGFVRIRAEEEQESYFDVFGNPDSPEERQEIVDRLNLNGCWCVTSEFMGDDGRWHHADSIGMCTGYQNVLDPEENDYVCDLMASAVNALEMQMCI
jgi:hypothetical protein